MGAELSQTSQGGSGRSAKLDGSNRPGELGNQACSAGSLDSIHRPVLLAEVLEALLPQDLTLPLDSQQPLRFLDATLGLGGHSLALLELAAQRGLKLEILGLDRDAEAQALARRRLEPFAPAVRFYQCAFANFPQALEEFGWTANGQACLDGALADLGVSSLQLDKAERGFSFLQAGPLDMRMDPQGGGESAAALLARLSVAQLKEIIEELGEESQAGRIARAIDDARSQAPITETLQLAAIVEQAYPPKWRATARNHPATRTFQALRLAVNDELGQLGRFLERLVPHLRLGGRAAIISFHSLEDRLVKHFFKTAASGCLCPPHLAVTSAQCRCGHQASLRLVTRKALEAAPEEVRENSRARSAKLRVAERIEGEFSLPGGGEAWPEAEAAGRGSKPGRAGRSGHNQWSRQDHRGSKKRGGRK